uniref:hypothetical protein n=1 Tax=Candidatus Pantoea persica TaxID=2518128 RepID=UPI00215DA2CD|nr:hypothetical protein [Candidatus Pantoea persica]MBA2817417.1 major facilitator superfamily transporter [Candidatus Pantoea persica]
MPDQPAAEPAHKGIGLTLLIISIVMYNFASYLTIGLQLAALPGLVHEQLVYSAFWVGAVISLQYLATLLSCPHAGRYADIWRPKRLVVLGLAGVLISGLCYLLASWLSAAPLASLALLCLGRVILCVGQSFTGTGTSLWGVARVGSLHIGRVILWNGICTYGAMALRAPLGLMIYRQGGLLLLSAIIIAICALETYMAFMDLVLGITGPVAGFIMGFARVPLVYLLTGLLVCLGLYCTLRLIRRTPETAAEVKEP